tara:strand:- start:1058 stop:1327 length:270 start_codon:yes stop_codon:yes gene_type:complete
MKKVENCAGPNGWLVDPHNKWAIHFDFKQLSNDQSDTNFTIDMWGVVSGGKPMEFKSRRKATKLDSIKTWKQLIASNWVELDEGKIKTA